MVQHYLSNLAWLQDFFLLLASTTRSSGLRVWRTQYRVAISVASVVDSAHSRGFGLSAASRRLRHCDGGDTGLGRHKRSSRAHERTLARPARLARGAQSIDADIYLAAAVVSLRAMHLLRFAFAGLFESRLLPDPAGVAQR